MPDAAAMDNRENVLARMVRTGWRFDFFQAVWLLERFGNPSAPVGGRGPVSKEIIRFRPDVAVGFPATDVRRVSLWNNREQGNPVYRIEQTFLGLYGVASPLPVHYAYTVDRSVADAAEAVGPEHTLPTEDVGCSPVRDFLDILHHRATSLYYRAWAKYRFDRTFPLPERDRITDYLLWLIGCPREYEGDLTAVSPIALLRYGGALTQKPKSAAMLEGMLADYWRDIHVKIRQFKGRWVPVPLADLNELGSTNCGLGANLTLGEEIYDLSGAFTVALGPVDWDTYVSFLPGGDGFARTRTLVQVYCGDPLSFSIELTLRPGQARPTQLASEDAHAARLGMTSWTTTGDLGETTVTFEADGPPQSRGTVEHPQPSSRQEGPHATATT